MEESTNNNSSEQQHKQYFDQSPIDSQIEDTDYTEKFEGKKFTTEFNKVKPTLSRKTLELIPKKRWQIQLDKDWISLIQSLLVTNCQNFSISIQQPNKKPDKSQKETFNPFIAIFHIQFTHLRELDLSRLQIHNIEPIAHSDMPQLRTLNLTANHITSIKPFNKTKWPFLRQIDFKRNKIQQADLSRAAIEQLTYYRFNLWNNHQLLVCSSQVYVKLHSQRCLIQSNAKSTQDEQFTLTFKISQALIEKCNSS